MKTKTKMAVAREIIVFFSTIAAGVLIYGVGEITGLQIVKKIGIFFALMGYILFYVLFRVAIIWRKRCDKYPL